MLLIFLLHFFFLARTLDVRDVLAERLVRVDQQGARDLVDPGERKLNPLLDAGVDLFC